MPDVYFILLLWMLLQGPGSQTPKQFEDTLVAVSQNIKQLKDAQPDFVCNEKITSTAFKSGRLQSQKVVESVFSYQKSREHREVVSVDGKSAKKGAKLPGMPVNIRGSFNFMILTTFSPETLEWYDFAQKRDDAGRRLVQFETKKDLRAITWDIAGDYRIAQDTGLAWIDTGSMQVSRFERNLLNLGRDFSTWKITIEQAPFTLGDRQFWLPTPFRTDIVERDTRNSGTFLAEYTNCKKFTTDVTIRPRD